jgi:hypothetical protein
MWNIHGSGTSGSGAGDKGQGQLATDGGRTTGACYLVDICL